MHYGTDILHRLNGIFSFAVWNDKKQELFLVRDHFGIKPLYYAITDETIIFASEVKAILAHPQVEAKIDKTSICELFGLRTCTYTWKWNI